MCLPVAKKEAKMGELASGTRVKTTGAKAGLPPLAPAPLTVPPLVRVAPQLQEVIWFW